ncbi:putative K(+)-stimulated pyrophosphate-energized sodium pump [compost metagenome]
MMLPGILTIGFPIAIVLLGKLVYPENNQLIAEMLGGYMAGVTVSGVLWAVFQNNAGGAWDNAKKSFEAGVMINGEMTYKGSDAHKAAVTGDTVGDPFKDTSGPSMNILIKLTCLIGLVIAPILGGHDAKAVVQEVEAVEVVVEAPAPEVKQSTKEIRIESVKSADGKVKATVTTVTDSAESVEVFEGTEAEVNAKLEAFKKK